MKAVISKADVIAALDNCLISPGLIDYDQLLTVLQGKAFKTPTTRPNGLADAISHAERQIYDKQNRYAHNQREIAAIFGITPKTLRNWLTLGVIDTDKARDKPHDILHRRCFDGRILLLQAMDYLSIIGRFA